MSAENTVIFDDEQETATPKPKKRTRATLTKLVEMSSPTKDFEFINPQDPEEILVFTARKLSPGHMLRIKNPVFIKAYEKKMDEDDTKDNNTEDGNTDKPKKEGFEDTMENLEFSAEVASLSIVDEHNQTYLTLDDVMLHMLPEWHAEISNWALGGASLLNTKNPDEIDGFPNRANG